MTAVASVSCGQVGNLPADHESVSHSPLKDSEKYFRRKPEKLREPPDMALAWFAFAVDDG